MRFYLVMTVATVLGVIAAAVVLFLAGRLLTALLPHAWAVARDLHARARARSVPAVIGYWAAWVLLFPVMLILCLAGGGRRLWHEGRAPRQAYPHLMSGAGSDKEKSDEA